MVGTDSAALTLTAKELDALQSSALPPAAVTLAALRSAELLLAVVASANLPLVALPLAAGPLAAVVMDSLLLGSLHRQSYHLPQWCCTISRLAYCLAAGRSGVCRPSDCRSAAGSSGVARLAVDHLGRLANGSPVVGSLAVSRSAIDL